MDRQVLTVSNMTCNGCVANIQKALEADERVKTIDIQLSKKRVTVSGELTADETAKIIQDAGYDASIGAKKTGLLSKLFNN
jgi:copper chaperone CopZ